MPRRRLVLIALAALGTGSALAMPWTLGSPRMAERIATDLARSTGLVLRSGGAATIALLPVPRIKLTDVSLLSADGKQILSADTLRGDLGVWSLLRGQVRISSVLLTQPRIDVVWEGGSAPWQAAWDAFRDPKMRAGVHLDRVTLVGGSAVISGKAPDHFSIARDINLVLAPARPGSGIAIAGSLTWRGEQIDVRIEGPAAGEARASKGQPVSAQIRSPLANLRFDGVKIGERDAQYAGNVTFDTRSLEEFSRLVRAQGPLLGTVRAFRIEGNVTASSRGFDMDAAQIRMHEDRLDGVLSGRVEQGRLAISGTLDAPTLDFTPLFSGVGPVYGYGNGWSLDPINWAPMRVADLDLRLSSAAARVRGLRLSDAAVSLLVKNGRLELNLARASAYRGTARGRLSITQPTEGAPIEARTQVTLERVDAGAFLADMGRQRLLTGNANVQFTLETSGRSFADLVQTAQGKAGLMIRQGEFIGVSFADALRTAERRPLSAVADWRGGRSAFEQATINLTIRQGNAEVASGVMKGAAIAGKLSGSIALSEQFFSLRSEIATVANGKEGIALPFTISGPWDSPTVLPDVRSLIQRSLPASSLVARPPVLAHPVLGSGDEASIAKPE